MLVIPSLSNLKNRDFRISKNTRDHPTDRRTDGPMDGWTDGRTDTTSYRDAWSHLKNDGSARRIRTKRIKERKRRKAVREREKEGRGREWRRRLPQIIQEKWRGRWSGRKRWWRRPKRRKRQKGKEMGDQRRRERRRKRRRESRERRGSRREGKREIRESRKRAKEGCRSDRICLLVDRIQRRGMSMTVKEMGGSLWNPHALQTIRRRRHSHPVGPSVCPLVHPMLFSKKGETKYDRGRVCSHTLQVQEEGTFAG